MVGFFSGLWAGLHSWATYIWDKLPILLTGAWLTVQLTVISVGLGSLIGTFAGLGRVSKSKFIRVISAIYVDVIRGTPLLVQIFIVYMGLPQLLQRPIDAFAAAIAALSINSGAYVAEIVRAGIQSIDKGQTEASHSLGMGRAQTMLFIILPQAFRRIIPPMGNEFIAMLKDSSLVSVISLEELLRRGQIITSRDFRPFDIYAAVAIIYLIMTFTISRLVSYSERRLKTGD